jgi:hypothetical protein
LLSTATVLPPPPRCRRRAAAKLSPPSCLRQAAAAAAPPPSCRRRRAVRWSATRGTSSYKIKNELFSLEKLHWRVAEIVRHHVTWGDCTHLLFWSRWKPAAGGIMVSVFFLGVCCLLFFCVVHEVTVLVKKFESTIP